MNNLWLKSINNHKPNISSLNRTDILKKYPNALIPQSGLQTKALRSSARFTLLGGAAGACKTFTLFLESLRHISNPNYIACFFRGAATSIFGAGGLWDTASKLYPKSGGKSNQIQKVWKFPSGAKIFFRNLDCRSPQRVKEELRGFQYNLGFFDEVTELSEDVFWFAVSRCRDTGAIIDPQIYMTCNPKICWVKNLVEDVLDKDGYPIKELAEKTRYFYRLNGEIIWGNFDKLFDHFKPKIEEDLVEIYGKKIDEIDQKIVKKQAKNYIQSFKFLPGTLEDNKILQENDPTYRARLESLAEFDRLSMLYGCWHSQEEVVAFYKKWFNEYDIYTLPKSFDFVVCCVDTATQKQKLSDYSAATIWGYINPINNLSTGKLYLIDLLREKLTYIDLRVKLSGLINSYHHLFTSNTSAIYIEQANVGTALYHEFKQEFNMIRLAAINRHINKFHRARQVQGFLEKGGLYLPSTQKNIKNIFIEEVCQFRFDGKHDHDDITDTMMDAIEICFIQKQYLRLKPQPELQSLSRI